MLTWIVTLSTSSDIYICQSSWIAFLRVLQVCIYISCTELPYGPYHTRFLGPLCATCWILWPELHWQITYTGRPTLCCAPWLFRNWHCTLVPLNKCRGQILADLSSELCCQPPDTWLRPFTSPETEGAGGIKQTKTHAGPTLLLLAVCHVLSQKHTQTRTPQSLTNHYTLISSDNFTKAKSSVLTSLRR